MHSPPTQSTLKIARDLLRRYPYRSFVALSSLIVAGMLEIIGVATLLPLLSVIDESGASNSKLFEGVSWTLNTLGIPLEITALLFVIIVLVCFKAAFSMLAMKNVGYAVADIENEWRLNFINSLMHANWKHFSAQPLGQLANTVGTEANRSARTFFSLCKFCSELITVLLYLIATLFISWTLTLAALLLGGMIVICLYKLVTIVKIAGAKQTRHMSDLSVLITDSIAAVKIIKATGKEKHYLNLLRRESHGLREAKRRRVIGKQALQVTREPIIIVLIVLGFYINTKVPTSIGQSLSHADLLTFAFMFFKIMQRISNLQSIYQTLTSDESAYWSLMNTIEKTEDQKEKWTGRKKPSLKNSLKLDNVTFYHEEDAQPQSVFDNFSLNLPVKQLNFVVGPSGSGKTTLIDLIVGFYAPQKGQILIDGTPLNEIDIGEWRKSIGYVPQDCPLFHDSIFNNIAMGNESITDDDVIAALNGAGASDFLSALENGVHEIVGERGQRFSGGQRQRIAIARALVTKPELLILDEATSALDSKTEAEIFKTIKQLSKKITIIAISHNEDLQEYADFVHKIDKNQ